ncbi:MAG: bifunctional demethylmenaquinone methyltransferase/2-methoxy-6-polyprenyl-1,4-benzoquinol methylase UbiE [Gammaproteobacteria bacterium]|nr:bifunctional demethylmenaquinone methyltransferase/2-methoxy-6-polyprenyl-1,4-benzoquinol methylase UbiE [Gammaproteobacteria bacterium]
MKKKNDQDSKEPTTHFGFQDVPTSKKAHKVAEVFHSVADNYDLMNDLMSLGIHRLWKKTTIHLSGVRTGQKVLDIAGGTGDLAKAFSKAVGNTGLVILSDINASMLARGRDRLLDNGITHPVHYVQANAETLPFPDAYFDCVTIAFGLRNVTHKEKALASMQRIIKPGGKLMVLEFSKPLYKPLEKIYDAYSFSILPRLGKMIANDEASYRYLAESIRMHPDQETLKNMILTAGFDACRVHHFSGGIVALHIGINY